ncbi:MAG: HlyC/CorC family transporter [Legionellaceae bacterium]|nr:HlyC/CorC family transporter [Legionellaceae bacterium]
MIHEHTFWMLLFLLVLLVLFSGFCTGSEIGIMSLNRYKLRHLARQNQKQALRINTLLEHPERLLGTLLIGNTLANIVASSITTIIGHAFWGDIGIWISTAILSILILVFAEMIPKILGALYPQRVAFGLSFPLIGLQLLLSPVVRLLTATSNALLRLCGISTQPSHKESSLSGEELRSVVHETQVYLPSKQKNMLISLLDLADITVEDIMIPKSDIIGIDLHQSWHLTLEQLSTFQHTRIPVYRTHIDQILGMVHLRDVLQMTLEETLTPEHLLKIMSAPYFIPETTPLLAQISHFQKNKNRSCFVVDEYGELVGLVTIENILEEIVGEFTTDIASLSKNITPQKDGTYLIDASIPLRQLQRSLNWTLPSLGPKTLNGLITETLGTIPSAPCCLRINQYYIEILQISEHTIKNVRMWEITP